MVEWQWGWIRFRHCERSEAIQSASSKSTGLPRAFGARNDGVKLARRPALA
jgi:hypothetical protein